MPCPAPSTRGATNDTKASEVPCSPPTSLARLSPSHATYSHFRTHHLLPNLPCLFPPSYTQAWPVFHRWVTENGALALAALEREYGREETGGSVIECVGKEGGEDEGQGKDLDEDEKDLHCFEDLIDLWMRGRGRRKYLKDWHLPLLVHRSAYSPPSTATPSSSSSPASHTFAPDPSALAAGRLKVAEELYTVPPCWLDDWMNEHEGDEREGRRKGDDFRFVYAGGGETWTGLHRDVYCSYSISTNLYGRKRWYLFPPDLTPLLRPLIASAEREERPGGVNPDAWREEDKRDWVRKGMLVVEQEQGETIFLPSGWYHSTHNLTHPTLSLNHNWLNAHCLPAVYSSLCNEVERARDAIADVRELLREQARRNGTGQGDEVWKGEWEAGVDGLVERSEGWSFPTFFRMTLHTLRNVAVPFSLIKERAAYSRWPAISPEYRPPSTYVVAQVRPIMEDFRRRREQEWKWLPGLKEVVEGIEAELQRIEKIERGEAAGPSL
ncbi:hypothetical protein JCM11251_006561 [Rhodosporidiobolus azoricus]